jgi:hypothetical protein
MVFQMLLGGECYENVYNSPHTSIWKTTVKLFFKHLALPVKITVRGPKQSTTRYSAHLSPISQLCLHQSSGNSFQRQMFPFFWVLELSPYLSHSNSQLTPAHLLLPSID